MSASDLISVIVPIYNTSLYLSECINSVLNQSYENFELILVDDGSTDDSLKICESFSKKDERIKIVKKQNGGLSSARNVGVKEAKGEYICFVDSDDIVSQDYLKILYGNIKKENADVSYCDFIKFKGSYICKDADNTNVKIMLKPELFELLTQTGAEAKSTSLVVAWNKLIRADIAKSIEFPKGKWHEDEFYINSLLDNAKRFVKTNAILYYYRQRDDSIVGEDNKYDLRHLDIIDAFKERIELYSRTADAEFLKKIISAYRNTLIISYAQFMDTKEKGKIKSLFLKSFFEYPNIDKSQIKGYIVFILSPKLYYKKYWG